MPLAANAQKYRRPEIGEASGSNSRVPARRQNMTDRSDVQAASSTAGSSTSSSLKSSPSVSRAKPVGLDLSLVSDLVTIKRILVLTNYVAITGGNEWQWQ